MHEPLTAIGYCLVHVLGLVILLAAMGKCLELAEMRRANARCLRGLAVVLFGCFALVGVSLARPFFDFSSLSPTVQWTAVGAFAAVLVAGVALAVVGLAQTWFTHRGSYRIGVWQAVTGIVIALAESAFVGLLVAGLINPWQSLDTADEPKTETAVAATAPSETAVVKEAEPKPAKTVSLPSITPEQVEEAFTRAVHWATSDQYADLAFPTLNFGFHVPPRPWVAAEPLISTTSPELRFVLSESGLEFLLFVDVIGVERHVDTRLAAEGIKAGIRAISKDAWVIGDRETFINGHNGIRVDSSFTVGDQRITRVQWIYTHGGFTYVLQLQGPVSQHAVIFAEANRLFDGFHILDKNAVIHTADVLAGQDYSSSEYGFEVKLADSPWTPWKKVAATIPAAAYGALHPNGPVLVVIPVFLRGHDPHIDALGCGMLNVAGMSYESLPLARRRSIDLDDYKGVQYTFDRSNQERKFVNVARVMKGHGQAWLVLAYGDQTLPGINELLVSAVEHVKFKPGKPPAAGQQVSALEIDRQGLFFFEVGEYHYRARQFEIAETYYQLALDEQPRFPAAVARLVDAFMQRSEYAKALDVLERSTVAIADQPVLRVRRAELRSQLGKKAEAIDEYASVFASGFRQDEQLISFVGLLLDANQPDRAQRIVDQYLEKGDSAQIVALKAQLLLRDNKTDTAIALLKGYLNRIGFNYDLTLNLVMAYRKAERYQDALPLVDELLKQGFDSATTYKMRGHLEAGLKRYKEAKASFETALAKAPLDPELKTLIAQTSAQLGEGENAMLKQPLRPIELPKDLAVAPPAPLTAAELKDVSACYLRRALAIEFRAGQEYRETTYRSIRVLDDNGVRMFSTLETPFDAVGQQAYVNVLNVFDERNQLVGRGNVASYYIIDDTSGDVASNRKIVKMPVPGLRPGYRIELVYTIHHATAPQHFPFTSELLTSALPVERAVLWLHGDVGSVGIYESSIGRGSTTGGGIYWISDHPPIYRPEPLVDDPYTFLPTVYLGDARAEWKQEGLDYLKLVGDRLPVPTEIRELAEEKVKNLKEPAARVAALVRYVQGEYTYKAIEFGRRARIMNTSPQIVSHKYGDCKDHSLLLYHLLRGADIPAELALINTAGPTIEKLPSLDQFNHVIVFLPQADGSGRFIDTTDKSTCLSAEVPYGLAGKQALVLDPRDPHLVRVPDYPAGSNTLDAKRTWQCTADGDLVGRETLRLSGYYASFLRASLKGLDAQQQKSFLNDLGGTSALQVENVSLGPLDAHVETLSIQLEYRLSGVFQTAGDQLVGALPLVWERTGIAADYLSKRQTPFREHFPLRVKVDTVLEPPEGYRVAPSQAPSTDAATDFFDWKVRSTVSPAGLEMQAEYFRHAGHFAADRYPSFYDAAKQARKALSPTVTLVKTKKPAN